MLVPYLEAWIPSHESTRDLGRGTAFPASADLPGGLQAGDRFFRTDLGWLCSYDGTRWLTVHEYSMPLEISNASTPVTYAAAGNTVASRIAYRNDYSLYITRVSTITIVATTNDGTNNWTYSLRALVGNGTSALTIHTFTTAADAAGTQSTHDAAPSNNAVVASRNYFDIVVTKNNAPGALTLWSSVYYRLIVT